MLDGGAFIYDRSRNPFDKGGFLNCGFFCVKLGGHRMPRVNFETSSTSSQDCTVLLFPVFHSMFHVVSRCFTLFHCCEKNRANLVHATLETLRVSEFKIVGSLVERGSFGKSRMIVEHMSAITQVHQRSPSQRSWHWHRRGRARHDGRHGIFALPCRLAASVGSV